MTLLEFRRSRGLTQAAVATALGCSQAAVDRWEKGRRLPRAADMQRIAAFSAGQVTPNDFHGLASSSGEPSPAAGAAAPPARGMAA